MPRRIMQVSLAVMGEEWPPWLHVDNSRQLLDSVEQQISLLDGFLVLPVFAVGSKGEEQHKDLH